MMYPGVYTRRGIVPSAAGKPGSTTKLGSPDPGGGALEFELLSALVWRRSAYRSARSEFDVVGVLEIMSAHNPFTKW